MKNRRPYAGTDACARWRDGTSGNERQRRSCRLTDDLISRSAVHVAINSQIFDTEYPSELDEIKRLINEIPAIDAVPVVRCKDCRNWGTGFAGETDKIKECKYACYMVGENGYCVYAEEKDRA